MYFNQEDYKGENGEEDEEELGHLAGVCSMPTMYPVIGSCITMAVSC